MNPSGSMWSIVCYERDSPFKKVRVRDDARISTVLRHLQAHECVALLGPPLSEKSDLLLDVAGALEQTGFYRPLYLDLWLAQSSDEASFFSSLAGLIQRGLGQGQISAPPVTSARGFQNYLSASADAQDRNLALLIDHLQALPQDLVHGLLTALRATYMECDIDAPSRLVAVVTGGMNLVGLSAGPTSPFNIARPVLAGSLSEEQSLALAGAALEAFGRPASPAAMERILDWTRGDHYLISWLCAECARSVDAYRRPRITRATVDRAAARLWLGRQSPPPIREAIRMIEEDPDSLLDVLHVLDHDVLPRVRSRQMITRVGTDRLQLSGAFVLSDASYRLKNLAYRQALTRHFTTERVAHVLRIAGRWSEAIDYLVPRLGGEPNQATRPQLLEAIVQSIYATDSLEKAFEVMAQGLRLGFNLSGVTVYRSVPAYGLLQQVFPDNGPDRQVIELDSSDAVESQAFLYGNYALRGSSDEARLVVALVTPNRPVGVVTVEKFVSNRDPHETPDELPDLLRFLQHASSAIENVMIRTAYRRIGQAVLDAGALEPTLARVLEAVADALGCDFANLYLVSADGSLLEEAAGVGRGATRERQGRISLDPGAAARHPAAACLAESRMFIIRDRVERSSMRSGEGHGPRDRVMAYLPLQATGTHLGALELGYVGGLKIALSDEGRRRLASFADQVAIAVHNVRLLQRTEEARVRRVEELDKLRAGSLAISSKLTLEEGLERISRSVRVLFPGSEVAFWEYRLGEDELLLLQTSLAGPLPQIARLELASLTGDAILARELRQATQTTAAHSLAEQLGRRGVVAVPLISHDRVLGAMDVYTPLAPAAVLDSGGAALLEAFAAQAAVAIDNDRLQREEIARQRLEEELAVGRQIQLSMIPTAFPSAPGWDFATAYHPARIVGGDFYDHYELPGRPARLGLLIADVAGKGVPAALFMALSRTIIRTTALSGRGPASALMRANQLILKDSKADLFLSAVYAVLELHSGRLIYGNAGHNRPLLYRAETAQVEELPGRGTILGSFDSINVEESRVDLQAGDTLIFYTDGITESANADGLFFGEDRLKELVIAHGRDSAADIVAEINAALGRFAAGAEQADDVAIVVVKRL